MGSTKSKPKKPAKSKEPAKIGAPTKKTQPLLDKLCEGISVGKSARAMCLECDISQPTLWKWLAEDEAFAKQYARAKQECADFIAEQILEIADTPLLGVTTKTGDDGKVETTEGDMIQHRRLQVDARKWYASKLAPKKYGEKLELGGDSESPLIVEITRFGASK